MIIPDSEFDNLKALSKVFDCTAIHAKRCEMCNKIFFVNLKWNEKFVCFKCRGTEINQGGV